MYWPSFIVAIIAGMHPERGLAALTQDVSTFKVQLILDLTKCHLRSVIEPTFCDVGPFFENDGPTEPHFEILDASLLSE